MAISVFDPFKIGMGPSRSPTVGALRDPGAARRDQYQATLHGGLPISAIER